jgi:hypothetical protein
MSTRILPLQTPWQVRSLINLENGESDLFKINIQQEKLIQSKSKLVKLTSEMEKQKLCSTGQMEFATLATNLVKLL